MIRSHKLAFAVLAALCVALPASAYVLSSRAVIRRFAEKQALDKKESSVLVGRAWLAGPGPDGRSAPAHVELGPGTCSVRLEFPEGNVGASWANGKVSTDGSRDNGAVEALVALGCPLQTMHGLPAFEAEAAVSKVAGALRVTLGKMTLARGEGRVAFAVGGRPKDLASPQIWFEKSTSRPMRVIAEHAGKSWDVRYTDARSIATGGAHPRLSEVFSGGEKLLSLRLMMPAAGPVPTKADDGEAADEETPE